MGGTSLNRASDEPPRWAYLLVAVVGAAAVVASLWIVDYLPTHDGPQHIFSGHLENTLDRLVEPYSQLVVEAPNLTCHGFRLLFVPLERVFGWRTATRLTLSVWVLVWFLGAMRLILVADRRRLAVAVLAPPLALGWALYLGFFNYLAGTALGLWVVAEGCSRRRWTPVFAAVLSLMLLGQAMVHVFACELTGLVLLVVELVRAEPGRRMRRAAVLAVIGLPALAVALTTVLVATPGFGEVRWLEPAANLHMAARAAVVGPSWRSLPVVLLAVAAVVWVFVRWRRRAPLERGLAVASALLGGLSLVMPMEIPGWEGLSPRFAPMALVCGLAVVPAERLTGRARAAGRALVLLFVAASMVWSYQFHLRLERGCAPLMRALASPVSRQGFRFFVAFRSCLGDAVGSESDDVPGACFVQHFGAVFATEQGGLPPLFQGQPAIHRFSVYTMSGAGLPGPELLDWRRLTASLQAAPEAGAASDELAARRLAVSTRIAEHASRYEDLVIFGSREQRSQIVARGWAADLETDEVFIGRFEGCTREVQLPPGWGTNAAVLVEYGWWPMAQPSRRWRWRPSLAKAGRLVLERAPCGPLWVRIALDLDGDGAPSPGDRFCAGSDGTGMVLLPDGAAVFECR